MASNRKQYSGRREEKGSDIPFIVFTGRGSEKVAMDAINKGADRYIRKGEDPRSQYKILAKAVVESIRQR